MLDHSQQKVHIMTNLKFNPTWLLWPTCSVKPKKKLNYVTSVTYWHLNLWVEGACKPALSLLLLFWFQGTKHCQLKRHWFPGVTMKTATRLTGKERSGSPMTAQYASATKERQNAWPLCADTQTARDQFASKASVVLPAQCPATGVEMQVKFGSLRIIPYRADFSCKMETYNVGGLFVQTLCSHG